MAKILVIGSGNFGICLANHLARQGHNISLFSRSQQVATSINQTRKHPNYLRDHLIHQNIEAITSTSKISENLLTVVLAIPTQSIRDTCKKFLDTLMSADTVTCASKGIEVKTGLPPSKVIAEEGGICLDKIALLSGPSFAIEVMESQPTCVAIASKNPKTAEKVQNIFHAPHFRCYTTQDTIGLEIASAMKNVIAIAAGASVGLGYGSNTQAALITRGLAEITRLGVSMGASPLTFNGLGGVGDLFLTCTSEKSRNFKVGLSLAKGLSLDQIREDLGSTAEGISTTKAIYKIGYETQDIPITEAVYNVLYKSSPIKEVVWKLMTRNAKPELT